MEYKDFCEDWLSAYLTERLGKHIELVTLERFTRGTSRQTWFASYRLVGEQNTHSITLRTDHPSGSGDPTSLDQEYFIYKCLGDTGLPVAGALWFENDLSKAPRAFYARQLIEGSWNIQGFSNPDPKYDSVRLEASREFMRTLAAVHQVDWKSAGFDQQLLAPQSVEDAGHCFVQSWMNKLDAQAEPLPLLYEMKEWLIDNAPPAPKICLCKGTNGFGEEVFRDGKIVALSDWEEVLIGDPASDLAMVQGFTETIVHAGEEIWSLEKALGFYRQESGIDVTMANIRYYQLARLFGRLVMFAHTTAVIADNPAATVRQSWTTTEPMHVVKRAIASAMGWIDPVDPAWFEEMNESVEMRENTQ